MRFERLWIVSSSSVLPTTYGFLYTQPSREILEHDCPSRIFEAEGTIAISMPLATLLSCDGGGRVPSTNPVVRAPPDLLKGDLPAVVFFFLKQTYTSVLQIRSHQRQYPSSHHHCTYHTQRPPFHQNQQRCLSAPPSSLSLPSRQRLTHTIAFLWYVFIHRPNTCPS